MENFRNYYAIFIIWDTDANPVISMKSFRTMICLNPIILKLNLTVLLFLNMLSGLQDIATCFFHWLFMRGLKTPKIKLKHYLNPANGKKCGFKQPLPGCLKFQRISLQINRSKF